jgi:ubiquinone/menaquinone biosynthesis C-methylase UbiE/uncharacterized protein YbaR (Trm112 family)
MTAIPFVCPACRGPIAREADAYVCAACPRRYPIVLGIPDFRLTPDPWISIEDDRAKGLALEARTEGLDLAATVEAYWAMTPTTAPERARRFTEHVLGGEARSREWLAAHGLATADDTLPWIDLGCGTADLAAVIAPARPVIAIDIAFRWLVVARRRLRERGIDRVTLACADAAALPLADRVAGRVVSLGLLEHVPDLPRVIGETARVLDAGGHVHLRTTNRYSLLPEPHVNVWGVGFVPARFADRYVAWRGGGRYQHLHPTSSGPIRRTMRAAGFSGVTVTPALALPSDARRLGPGAALVAAYNQAAAVPGIRRAIAWVAPLLEAHGVRR